MYSAELVIRFQEDEYSMLESSNQQICLVVQSGLLDPNIMLSVDLTTSSGAAVGKINYS